jgi:hypothetical protein
MALNLVQWKSSKVQYWHSSLIALFSINHRCPDDTLPKDGHSMTHGQQQKFTVRDVGARDDDCHNHLTSGMLKNGDFVASPTNLVEAAKEKTKGTHGGRDG